MYKRVLLKLSGEAMSSEGKCLDSDALRNIATEIKLMYDAGTQIGIVCGGGNIMRGRFANELGLERVSVDYIGMLGTMLNSLSLKAALEAQGVKVKVQSSLHMPDLAEDLNADEAKKELEEGYIVIFGAGTGKPYCSTDTACALRAVDINADVILIGKNNVDGVYSDDPGKNPDAYRYDILTYKEMLDKELQVIDLAAASICQENNIESFVFNMNVPGNILKASKQEVIGTRLVKE